MNQVKGFRSNFHFTFSVKTVLWGFIFCGLVTFFLGLFLDPQRLWSGFLQNHFYFMSLALGGLFFSVLQWTTGAVWSTVIRRFAESFTAYLPVVFLSFLILCLGISHLYGWSHPSHVQGDLVLEGKASYLNVSFFVLRNLFAIFLWTWLGRKILSHSLAQDRDGAKIWTEKNRFWSPIFLMVFALTFTMASFDQLMSLAILSPTAFNIQHWRFVVVTDPVLRQQMRAVSWNQAQVEEASLLLVLTADLQAWTKEPERYWKNAAQAVSDILVPAIGNFYSGNAQMQRDEVMRSCGMAAMTIMLAAKEMGYDTCPMDGFDFDAVGKLLNLPADHTPVMFVTVGKALKPASPRSGQLPLNEVVIQNKF